MSENLPPAPTTAVAAAASSSSASGPQHPPQPFVHPELRRMRESNGFLFNYAQFLRRHGSQGLPESFASATDSSLGLLEAATAAANAGGGGGGSTFANLLSNTMTAMFGAPFVPNVGSSSGAAAAGSQPLREDSSGFAHTPALVAARNNNSIINTAAAAAPATFEVFDNFAAAANSTVNNLAAVEQQQQQQPQQQPLPQQSRKQKPAAAAPPVTTETAEQPKAAPPLPVPSVPLLRSQRSQLLLPDGDGVASAAGVLGARPAFASPFASVTDAAAVPGALAFRAATPAAAAQHMSAELEGKQRVLATAIEKNNNREHYRRLVLKEMVRLETEALQGDRRTAQMADVVAALEDSIQVLQAMSAGDAAAATATAIDNVPEMWCPNLVDLVAGIEQHFCEPFTRLLCSSSNRSGAAPSATSAALSPFVACSSLPPSENHCLSKARLAIVAAASNNSGGGGGESNDDFIASVNEFLEHYAPFLSSPPGHRPDVGGGAATGHCLCLAPENREPLAATSQVIFLNASMLVLQNDVAREMQQRQFDVMLSHNQAAKVRATLERNPALQVMPWCATERGLLWQFLRSVDEETLVEILDYGYVALDQPVPSTAAGSSPLPLLYCPELSCRFRHLLEAPRRMCAVARMLSFAAQRSACTPYGADFVACRAAELRELLCSAEMQAALRGTLRHVAEQSGIAEQRRAEYAKRTAQQRDDMNGKTARRCRPLQSYLADGVIHGPPTAEELAAEEEYPDTAETNARNVFEPAGPAGRGGGAGAGRTNGSKRNQRILNRELLADDASQAAVACAATARTAGQLARWVASEIVNRDWHRLGQVSGPEEGGNDGAEPTAALQPAVAVRHALDAVSALLQQQLARPLAPSVADLLAASTSGPKTTAAAATPPQLLPAVLQQLTGIRGELIDTMLSRGISCGDVAAQASRSLASCHLNAATLLFLCALLGAQLPPQEHEGAHAFAVAEERDRLECMLALLENPASGVLPLDPCSQWNILVVVLTSLVACASSSSPGATDPQQCFARQPLLNALSSGSAAPALMHLPPAVVSALDGRCLQVLHDYASWVRRDLLERCVPGSQFQYSMRALLRAVERSHGAYLPPTPITANDLLAPESLRQRQLDFRHLEALLLCVGGSGNSNTAEEVWALALPWLAAQQEPRAVGSGHFELPAKRSGGAQQDTDLAKAVLRAEFWWNAEMDEEIARQQEPLQPVCVRNVIVGEAIVARACLTLFAPATSWFRSGTKPAAADAAAPAAAAAGEATATTTTTYVEAASSGPSPFEQMFGAVLSRLQRRLVAVIAPRDVRTGAEDLRRRAFVSRSVVDAAVVLPALRFAYQTMSVLSTVRHAAAEHDDARVATAANFASEFLSFAAEWSMSQSNDLVALLSAPPASSEHQQQDDSGNRAAELAATRRQLLASLGVQQFTSVADLELQAILAQPDEWMGSLRSPKPRQANLLQQFVARVRADWSKMIG